VLMYCDDTISNAMIGEDKLPFYSCVAEKMNERIPDILKEHGDVQGHIISAIGHYTQWGNWSITDGVLKIEERKLEVDMESCEKSKDDKCHHKISLGSLVEETWPAARILEWFEENKLDVPEHFI
jgi:hypothetical protein